MTTAPRDTDLGLDIEAALLARGATRRSRHLRVRCPAPSHTDTHPSADVDLERGWICRSCGRGGGLRELAELLGVTPAGNTPRHRPLRPPRVPPPPRGIARVVWAPAWTAIVDRARREDRRLAPYHDVFGIGDWLRRRHQLVADARRVASALGDDPGAWRLAQLAAHVQTAAVVIEVVLDRECRDVA